MNSTLLHCLFEFRIYYEEILFVWMFFWAVPTCYGCGG